MKKVKPTNKAQQLREARLDAGIFEDVHREAAARQMDAMIRTVAQHNNQADSPELLGLLLEYPEQDMLVLQNSDYGDDEHEAEEARHYAIEQMRKRYNALRRTVAMVAQLREQDIRKTKHEEIARTNRKLAEAVVRR